jgi:hypothetical protein
MSQTVADPKVDVSQLPLALLPLPEQILADLTMVAQIPAPTGEEEQRIRYVLDRFVEVGLPEVGPDEKGNAVGLLPGRRGERTIMLVAHVDTIYAHTVNHNVTLETDRVIGPGVGDNALGVAAVSLVPACLAHLGIELDSHLGLLASVRSLGRSNHEGQRCEAFSSRETQRLQRGRGRQTAGARRPPSISGEIGHKKCLTALGGRAATGTGQLPVDRQNPR